MDEPNLVNEDVNEDDVLTLNLTGVLIGERPIEGADCILIRGRHKSFNKADFNNDCKVDFTDFALFTANRLECNLDPPGECGE